MGALRNATNLGYEILTCSKCPTIYNMAVQNVQLLTTLLHLVVNEYGKLLTHIDRRALAEEKIQFRFGETSTVFDHRHTGAPGCPMAVNIDLSGEEWRTLARKAVRQEVIGSGDSNFTLLNLLHELRERQSSWHGNLAVRGNVQERMNNCHEDETQHENDCGRTCIQVNLIDRLIIMMKALRL